MRNLTPEQKMLIVSLEGLDKSGKNTQCNILYDWLNQQGYKVVRSEFHRYDQPTGQLIQKWLRKEWEADPLTLEFLIACDKQAQQPWFAQLERDGVDFLLLDRYTGSQLAYSTASGVSLEWAKTLQTYMRQPDLEIVIDIEPEVSIARKGKHGPNDRYEEDLELLRRVRQNYLQPAQNRVAVDGVGRDIFKIASDIRNVVESTFTLDRK